MAYTSVQQTVDAYEDYLDEVCEEVHIMGSAYAPSLILALVDPCAFKTGWIEWCDAADIDTDSLDSDYMFDWDR